MLDQFQRQIEYLRISVTDRCNFRCTYCMPEEGVRSISHSEILTFEEITRICRIAVRLGINKIKITGGEPLLRKNVTRLIAGINRLDGIAEVTMTTNGVLLGSHLPELKQAGIAGINISLDTLERGKFASITRRDELPRVLRSLQETVNIGIPAVKVNCVPIRGFNDDELPRIAELARDTAIAVRFIEMMPIGLGKGFPPVYQSEVLRRLEQRYGKMTRLTGRLGNGPAVYYQPRGFAGKIGFIGAMSHEFCDNCNRIRLTADGMFKLCLNFDTGINLKEHIRRGVADEALETTIRKAIYCKPKSHSFGEETPEYAERRGMFGIGG